MELIEREKSWRIAEIFGPTVQGEGRNAGAPAHFIRFGGCDYRCHWCDSPHAVIPSLVAKLERMTVDEICASVRALPIGPEWICLTGGNPLLFQLTDLCTALRMHGFRLMVETQGTIWQPWVDACDDVCVSPKPPSAGTMTPPARVEEFLGKANRWTYPPYLKVVVFDNEDYVYARTMHEAFPDTEFFLSVGTHHPDMPTVGNPHAERDLLAGVTRGEMRNAVSHDFRALAEKVASDRRMRNVRVLPQLHVLAWGIERGH